LSKSEELEDIIAGLLLVIDWLGDYVEDPDKHEEHVEYLYNTKWKKEFLEAHERYPAHHGDCTKSCYTCLACEIEGLRIMARNLIESKVLKME